MSLITTEFNYQRRAHRVTLPIAVEINGEVYGVRDWSMCGVGVEGISSQIELEQPLPARLTLPMQGSTITLDVQLQLRNRRQGIFGFEFYKLSPRNKRVLRHYVEHAVEGKLDNVEDLVSVLTSPSIDSPIEDSLNLSDLETEGLTQSFRSRSLVSLSVGAIFVLAVIVTMFYNTTYRVSTIGLVSGNLEPVTANSGGIITAIYVKPDTFIDAGTSLFTVQKPEDPGSASALQEAEISLALLTRQMTSLRAEVEELDSPIRDSLETRMQAKEREHENAKTLFAQRIITFKDFAFVEGELQRVRIAYQRAVDTVVQSRRQLEQRLSELEQSRQSLLAKRDLLLTPQRLRVISSPLRGKIHHIEHGVGQYVSENDVVVLMEKDASPDILLKLNTEDALKMRIGMPARVYVPTTQARYEARVASVGYSAVNSRATVSQEASLNETLVRLEPLDKRLRLPANTRVKVWIRTL